MKASAIAYGGILLILMITSLTIVYIIGGVEPVKRTIASVEGKLISFANEADILIKTFDTSIEFISQRSAFDLGKIGGLKSEVYWSEFYPMMDVLETNLEKNIENNLPSSDIKDKIEISWGNSNIDVLKYDVFPCGTIEDSTCFFVNGSKYITFYDSSTDSRVYLNPHRFYSQVSSNYFKLLNAGRAIMENAQFNQHLDDAGALLNSLYAAKASGDIRFNDIDFEASVNGNIVEINIVEKCYPPGPNTYCLAPLNPGETGITDSFGNLIPYDYNRLKFKYQKDQVGSTPLSFDFNVEATPDTKSLKSGDYADDIVVKVNKLGADSQIVNLDYEIIPNEPTISVIFTPSSGNPTYSSVMNITTTSMTMAGIYDIKIKGRAGALERTKIVKLTVNPSMFFDLTLNPDNSKIDKGASTTANVNLNLLGGNPSQVVLEAFVNKPCDCTITFSPGSCDPSCSSTMTINTQNTIIPDLYTITVKGTGGGTTKTDDYFLTIAKPFDFSMALTDSEKTLIITQGTSTTLNINLQDPAMLSKTVSLSYIINPNEPTISVDFNPESCDPTCSSTITIGTTSATPYNKDYAIIITGTGGGISHSVTYLLHVKLPACFSDADCNDSNPCTGVESEGKIDKCRNAGLVSAYCDRPNLGNGVYPVADGCGFGSGICPDKCDSSHEYKSGKSKACLIACNGAGACGSSCTVTASDCSSSDYDSDKTCSYGCKNDAEGCWDGYFCNSKSCSQNEFQCLSCCDIGGCPAGYCSCTVPAQRKREDWANPSCSYTWDCCTGWFGPICTTCGWCTDTCTASCSYSDACTYGMFCSEETYTFTDTYTCDTSTIQSNSCTIPAQCTYSEPTCTYYGNLDCDCSTGGYGFSHPINYHWDNPTTYTATTCS